MVSIGNAAQEHFRRLIQQQGDDILGLRLKVARAGTPPQRFPKDRNRR